MKFQKWQKIGLAWALWMFVIMTFVWPYFDNEKVTLKDVLIGIPFWLIAGLIFGWTQRKNLKEKKEN
ncbi:hypothetical protein RRF68_06560 [Tenacibaculum sp. HL-MS23]|uniref:hypothetical protein n=1 Tax=Tenacibaculum TaxID=104267 RepID=UPI0023B0CC7C|nr:MULTISPECIES: hypothetical protein [Tenacibaculum]WNW00670.1 hypothetical protein RRF68_06560 [Tenacibaculum sp. HL-MS23]